MDFIFSPYFQQSDKILFSDFCIFTVFENVSLIIKLHRSSLAARNTKHRTQNYKQLHSTRKQWVLPPVAGFTPIALLVLLCKTKLLIFSCYSG